MIVRKSSLIAVGGFDPSFLDSGGDTDLALRMIESRMALGWCPAGLVWSSVSAGAGQFFRARIRDGRADAILASRHPGDLVSLNKRKHPTGAIDGGGLSRVDAARYGLCVRALSFMFYITGAIAQTVARRYATIVVDFRPEVANRPAEEDYDLSRHLPIRNTHAHTAHSAAHH